MHKRSIYVSDNRGFFWLCQPLFDSASYLDSQFLMSFFFSNRGSVRARGLGDKLTANIHGDRGELSRASSLHEQHLELVRDRPERSDR